MPDNGQDAPPLPAAQSVALEAILAGKGDAAAARIAKVDRRTVSRWRHNPGPFRDALEAAHREIRSALLQDRIVGARVGLECLLRHARGDGPQAVQAATVLVRSVIAEPQEIDVRTSGAGRDVTRLTLDEQLLLREFEAKMRTNGASVETKPGDGGNGAAN